MSQSDLSGRLARWSLKLQGYNFKIEHRKGTQNIVPDALSRVHAEELHVETLDKPRDSLDHHVDLKSQAFTDAEYLSLIQKVSDRKEVDPNTKIVDGKLLIYIPCENTSDTDIGDWKLWLPPSLTDTVIAQAHEPPSSAHMGISKTLERLRRKFYWPEMTRDVKNFIQRCQMCKQIKSVNYGTRPHMGVYQEYTRPWQKLYLDFFGPYPRSKQGNTYILIVLDHFSRFVLLKPLREASASKVVNYLNKEVFSLFSVPEIVFTDNGPQFKSNIFKNFLQKHGVKHMLTPVYSPQSNASERVNRSILAAIRAYIKEDHTTWDVHLHEIANTLRNVTHSSTAHSPAYLVFGQHYIQHASEYDLLRLVGEGALAQSNIETKSDRLSLARERVLFHLKQAHDRSAQQYNLRSHNRVFTVGQKVLVRNFTSSDASKKYAAKLGWKFVPATIHRRVGNVAYELTDTSGKILGIFHGKDLRM